MSLNRDIAQDGKPVRFDMKRARRRGIVAGAAVTALLAAIPSAQAVVQDFNRARGGDGYTLTNGTGDVSGTFDGQEYQPVASSPGAAGEFFFVGAGLGQPFDVDARAPLGQGVTGT